MIGQIDGMTGMDSTEQTRRPQQAENDGRRQTARWACQVLDQAVFDGEDQIAQAEAVNLAADRLGAPAVKLDYVPPAMAMLTEPVKIEMEELTDRLKGQLNGGILHQLA